MVAGVNTSRQMMTSDPSFNAEESSPCSVPRQLPSLKKALLHSHLTIAGLGLGILVVALLGSFWLRDQALQLANVSTPSMKKVLLIQGGVQETLGALRGWMTLGEPRFRWQLFATWSEKIHPTLQELEDQGSWWADSENLQDLKSELFDLEETQWYIQDVAQSQGNIPARIYLQQDIKMLMNDMVTGVTGIQNLVHGKTGHYQLPLAEFLSEVRGSQASLENFVSSGQFDAEQDHRSHLDQARKWIVDAQQLANTMSLDQQELFAWVKQRFLGYHVVAEQVIEARKKPNWNIAQHLLATQAQPIVSRIEDELSILIARGERVLEEDTHQVRFISALVGWTGMALFLGMVGLAMWISRKRASRIALPIERLTSAARELAGGNRNQHIPLSGFDELRQLSMAFNNMSESLQAQENELINAMVLTQGIVNTAADAIITIDDMGSIESINKAACKTFGYEEEEVLGKNVSMLMPSPYHEEHDGYLARYRQSGEKRIIGTSREVKALRKDGLTFPVELAISEVQMGNRRVFTGIVRDISERKEAETAITRLLRQNQLLLDSAGEGIYGLDTQGKTTFVNPAAAQMLGYPPEELLGVPMHVTVHHSKADGSPYPRDECPMYAAFTEGSLNTVENEVLWRKDGTSFPVKYTSTPIRDEKGILIGAVVTFSDISERKKTEAVLFASEKERRLILDNVTALIAFFDLEKRYQFANKRYLDWFQLTLDEIKGKHAREVLGEEAYSVVQPFMEQAINGQEVTFEVYIPQGDETPRWVEATYVPHSNREGETEGFVAMVVDITQRKNDADALREARDEAYAAVKMKSEFLAMMSHEIRTPMNGVLGMTGILLESKLDKDQRECAETVKHSADALLGIINDILDFSKIESGKLDIEVIDFDLRVAVEEVLDLVGAKAQDKGLELIGLVYASVPTAVRGDPGRFRQILLNLVGNAIKFTEQGEVTIQVVPENETENHVLVRVDVTDTGIGLSPEAQDRLFQPFSQADASTTRKYGGTGLGLSICKQLAELMHGNIGVDSTPGHGSRFWFTVRLEKQAQPFERKDPPTKTLEGLRVCVVDDNDTNRLLLHHYTTAWGMSCLSAENGTAALTLMKDAAEQGQPCDLLLLDRQMPEMDGLDLARLVKADPALSGVKMVMLTSMGRRGDASAARDVGIGAYLTKPIHQSQLRECLWLVMNGESNGESQFVTKYTIQEAKKQVDARLLVADDNIVNQKVAVRMFEKMGYRVDVVANGMEAVDAVSRIPYDVVFMDCQMPEMDGYEATQTIRSREENGNQFGRQSKSSTGTDHSTNRIPIIAMTANAMKGDREKCLAAGMDDFVSKPVKVEELERVLAHWIPRQEDEAENAEATIEPAQIPIPSKEQSAMNQEMQSPALDAATIEGLKELGDGDPSFLVEVIQQFLQDAPGHVAAIKQAVAEGNADALMKAAHGFKGSCRNMGTLPLAEICFTLEQKGREGDASNLEDLLTNLEEECARAHAALEAELAGFPA